MPGGMRICTLPLVLAIVAGLSSAEAREPRPDRFDPARIGVAAAPALRSALAGQQVQASYGARALRRAGRPAVHLARQIHKLMPDGPAAYDRVLITPAHVALLRKGGPVELIRRADAEAQLGSGQPLGRDRLNVGIRAGLFPIFAEAGPGDTVFLYRQLPASSCGEIASTDCHTSFALGAEDAFHPFGRPGKTVRLAVPRKSFDNAVNGVAGAVGWNDLGHGYDTGLEVETEVQIPSSHVRQLFP
jgi:hypothetical protein